MLDGMRDDFRRDIDRYPTDSGHLLQCRHHPVPDECMHARCGITQLDDQRDIVSRDFDITDPFRTDIIGFQIFVHNRRKRVADRFRRNGHVFSFQWKLKSSANAQKMRVSPHRTGKMVFYRLFPLFTMSRKLFVTTALPYANAPFHIGHIMEYIQANIWIRFQRMQEDEGKTREVYFVGADDVHGAPIMIAAEKAGKTPREFVAEIAAGRAAPLKGFLISFDNWHSTDGRKTMNFPAKSTAASRPVGMIATRTIEQFFDPVKQMFLPDRYIKGECPKCGAKDQYGDTCEVCSSVYAPTDLKNPYSVLTGATPVMKQSEHFFFLRSPTRNAPHSSRNGHLDKSMVIRACSPKSPTRPVNGSKEKTVATTLFPTGTSAATLPYFGIEIPDAPGKYFYVWLDAPVGYLASLKNYFSKKGIDYDAFMADPDTEQYHFIGKDIIYFHTLFWPAMLHFADMRVPNNVFVHGFITVGGEKMSKSRGTGISPLRYLEIGMNPRIGCATISPPSSPNVSKISISPLMTSSRASIPT